jgi:hypothetical protein
MLSNLASELEQDVCSRLYQDSIPIPILLKKDQSDRSPCISIFMSQSTQSALHFFVPPTQRDDDQL